MDNTQSFRDLKKSYNLKKRCFTKNMQSAIDSTQEVHSGWLKARTTFKRWTKVWCQIKPGYLILYTSQEAQKKHRLGVVLLSVCQFIKRPTKKEGFCFKLINPFGSSVWAKSSTRAIVFKQVSLTLRAADDSVGKLWLDALRRCHLSANLEGYQSVIDEEHLGSSKTTRAIHNDTSDSDDDGEHSTRHLECLLNNSSTSENTSISSFQNQNTRQIPTGKTFINGGGSMMISHENESLKSTSRSTNYHQDNNSSSCNRVLTSNGSSSQLGENNNNNNINHLYDNTTNFNSVNNISESRFKMSQSNSDINIKSGNNQQNDAILSLNSTKMVAKFSRYNWRELQLESVNYIGDEIEELGCAGIQSEEVHDSNKNFLWHIIKQLRPGMDLSKVTLPTFILEPRSFLEKLADYYYHCDILSDAVLVDDPVLRLINIVKWYLSGFYKKPKGPKKPYNPILGERFRCFWEHPRTQSRTFFVAEQVSHHPPISAFHVSNRKDGYTITCALLSRSKFGGNSVSAILDGKARLYLNKRGETYTLTMPYANCRGILLGSLCLELGGKVEIECAQTSCKCELDFKLAPVWANANSYNTLTGKILKANKVTHTLDGHWDKKIDITDMATQEKSILWEVSDSVRGSRLKRYTVSIKDQHERESVKLWSKVTEALVAQDQTVATTEKTRLEDMQRKEARERKGTFVPEHFELKTPSNDWSYRWLDDRSWDPRRDIMQFEDNFRIRTLMLDQSSSTATKNLTSTTFNPNVDLPLTQLSKFSKQVEALDDKKGLVERVTGISSIPENLLRSDTLEAVESNIAAGNLLYIEEAIKQVNENHKKLEEDVAILKRARGKRTLAVIMTAIIIALMSAFFKYFA